jgi:hypothetical protein
MSTFRKFGGLGYNQKNNIVTSKYGMTGELYVSDSFGDRNTRIVNNSHIDLSGNSVLRVDGIYFLDGTVQRTASMAETDHLTPQPSWGGSVNKSSSNTGIQGPPGPQGPEGPAGKDGQNVSNVSDQNHNTFAGTQALLVNSDKGKYNNAFGERALMKNVDGYANSAYGYESMVNNTSGAFNTGVGSQALAFNIAGTRNTAIGASADVSDPAIHNSTAIGAGSRANASNVIQLGNDAIEHVITSGIITGKAKNFTIDHPVASMCDTHHLKHASIEAPRLDLIYRDTVALRGGKATVSIDKHFSMTEGTFVELCTNPSVFVSNESDWDPVKASISGNILSIECKNPNSLANVSFMVVAERRDASILASSITDASGKFIPETLK